MIYFVVVIIIVFKIFNIIFFTKKLDHDFRFFIKRLEKNNKCSYHVFSKNKNKSF